MDDYQPWIDVKDRLPVDNEGKPSHDWVLVSDGETSYTIARYAYRRSDRKLIHGWEFFDNFENLTTCPYEGDAVRTINLDEIRYWMPFPKTPTWMSASD